MSVAVDLLLRRRVVPDGVGQHDLQPLAELLQSQDQLLVVQLVQRGVDLAGRLRPGQEVVQHLDHVSRQAGPQGVLQIADLGEQAGRAGLSLEGPRHPLRRDEPPVEDGLDARTH